MSTIANEKRQAKDKKS